LPVYFLLIAGIIAVASTLLFLWRRNRRRPVSAKRTFSTLTSRVSPLEKAQDEPPNLGPGYRITGLINSGAQGSVFLAESPGGARWAVKVPRLGHGNGLEKHQLQLFLREAELSRRLLDTTNIIPVYAAHVEESGLGRPYYIMEYFDGISLRDYIDRFSPLPPDRAISSIVLRVLSALTYAHGREPGVLHRDLKPENVLVRAEEETGFIHELKIIDFGLSLGQIGTLVGTPPYVAPEIFRGEEPTAASDIFSLGLIFLEMLQDSDLPPFFGESISEMRNRILHEEYDREELPTAVVPLLDRMLAKDPMNRYRSAEQAAYDCQQVYFQMRKVAVGAKS
jgi:serine/threonine-protein kinase